MGLTSWIAGLLFFDLLVILIISSFALSGESIGSTSIDVTQPNINATTDYEISSLNAFISSFTFTVFSMPWWVNLFLITYNIGLLVLFGVLLFRGVN